MLQMQTLLGSGLDTALNIVSVPESYKLLTKASFTFITVKKRTEFKFAWVNRRRYKSKNKNDSERGVKHVNKDDHSE